MAKFKDICTKIGSGATPRGGKEAYCEDGISLIRSQNVLDFTFSAGGLVYINELQAEKLKNVIVEEDDVLLNITGDSVARACIVDKNYLPARVNQHVCIIRANSSKVIPSYLLYYLQLNKEYLLQLASGGATRNALTKDMVNNLELELPTVEEQQRIVAVLNDIQKKIYCNNAVNENLEHQSLALFSNYYEQSNTEIDFTDLIQVLGGGTPKTRESTYWNGNIPFFTPKDVGFPYTLATEKTITEDGLLHCNSRLYPVNTVFVTARGTVGKVGIAGVPMAMNQSCYALIGKGIHQLLVYFYTLKAIDRLKHKASGAVFDAIITKDFETEQVFKLSPNDTDTFIRIVEPMYQSILNNSIEKQRLIALRDSLLPKLMSGEIDVSKLDI